MLTKTSRHPSTPHVGDSVSSSESRRADARRHPQIPPTRLWKRSGHVRANTYKRQKNARFGSYPGILRKKS